MITDMHVVKMMSRYGGSFVKALAEAYKCADPKNRAKIITMWPDYWKTYREMAEQEQAESE